MGADLQPVESSSIASQSGEFSLSTVDVPRLLSHVTATLEALEGYENWVTRYGHQSVATAELLADTLLTANRELHDHLEFLWWQYGKSDSCESGLFGIVKSLREASARIYAKIPNDPSLPGDEPLFIRLSEKVLPVSFGDLTLDQFRFAQDTLKSWAESKEEAVSPSAEQISAPVSQAAAPSSKQTEPQSSRQSQNGPSDAIGPSVLQKRRLAALHDQFLIAAKRYPYLSVVVVRPHDPVGEWPHFRIPGGLHRGLPVNLWKKLFRDLGYRTGKLFAPLEVAWLQLNGELWEGGFYNTADNARGDEYVMRNGRPVEKDGHRVTKLQAQFHRLQRGLKKFRELGDAAANHFEMPAGPAVGSYAELFTGHGPWNRWLELHCSLPSWEIVEGSVVRAARLTSDVFTASAQLIEFFDSKPQLNRTGEADIKWLRVAKQSGPNIEGHLLGVASPKENEIAVHRPRSASRGKKPRPPTAKSKSLASPSKRRAPTRKSATQSGRGDPEQSQNPQDRQAGKGRRLPEKPFLGCTIDPAAHAIVRGKRKAVFTGAKPFGLACRLVDARADGLLRKKLEEHLWNGRPRTPNALDQHKSKANAVLAAIQLTIESDRDVWRLIPTDKRL